MLRDVSNFTKIFMEIIWNLICPIERLLTLHLDPKCISTTLNLISHKFTSYLLTSLKRTVSEATNEGKMSKLR